MPGKADPERSAAKRDWEKAFGSSPPPYLSVAFMRRALAHEAQCKASGGLPAATARALRQIANGKPASEARFGVARPGTHLVRE